MVGNLGFHTPHHYFRHNTAALASRAVPQFHTGRRRCAEFAESASDGALRAQSSGSCSADPG